MSAWKGFAILGGFCLSSLLVTVAFAFSVGVPTGTTPIIFGVNREAAVIILSLLGSVVVAVGGLLLSVYALVRVVKKAWSKP